MGNKTKRREKELRKAMDFGFIFFFSREKNGVVLGCLIFSGAWLQENGITSERSWMGGPLPVWTLELRRDRPSPWGNGILSLRCKWV